MQYLLAVRGTPTHIRSDNGPEFVSKVICRWLKEADVKTLFIAKGSPWENGYVESFNDTLRDELLNREIFLSFEEACWVIDRWRLDYNHHRIHSSLDYQTPAAYAAGCVLPASATPQPPEHSRITNPILSLNLAQRPGGSQSGYRVAIRTWSQQYALLLTTVESRLPVEIKPFVFRGVRWEQKRLISKVVWDNQQGVYHQRNEHVP